MRPFSDAQSSWTGNHVVSLSQFSRAALAHLCGAADAARAIVMRRGGCDVLRRRVLASAFMEPSTRTSCSFAAAMQRLGGSVVAVNETTSSAAKGESLADTVRTLLCYADALVLRHPQQGSAATASAHCGAKPLLNAGDGVGEHPTQALLDLYTILSEQLRSGGGGGAGGGGIGAGGIGAGGIGSGGTGGRGGIDGLTVTLVGDLKHGRTVHSLARLLSLFDGVTVCCVSPAELGMPADVLAEVAAAGRTTVEQHAGLDAALLARTDVLYVTRVQKERFASAEEYERLRLAFVITPATLLLCKASAVVMHPLPRVGEIADEVDADPRAAYFRQMECGLFVRMALLAMLFGVSKERLEAEAAMSE